MGTSIAVFTVALIVGAIIFIIFRQQDIDYKMRLEQMRQHAEQSGPINYGEGQEAFTGEGATGEKETASDPTGTSGIPPPVEHEQPSGLAVDPDKANRAASSPHALQKPRRLGIEPLVLAFIAILSFVLGFVQGLIPVFLILGFLFGLLALLYFLKHPLSELLRAIVLVASLVLCGVLGAAINQDASGLHYRYLKEGSTQYRVDERAGRTDRLETGGWVPVAYDRPAQPVPGLLPVLLTSGSWRSGPYEFDKICFTADNSSGYVVDRIVISVGLQSKSPIAQDVTLKSDAGFIQRKRPLPTV